MTKLRGSVTGLLVVCALIAFDWLNGSPVAVLAQTPPPGTIVVNASATNVLRISGGPASSGVIDVTGVVPGGAKGVILGMEISCWTWPGGSTVYEISMRVQRQGYTTDFNKVFDYCGGPLSGADISMAQAFVPFTSGTQSIYYQIDTSYTGGINALIDVQGWFY